MVRREEEYYPSVVNPSRLIVSTAIDFLAPEGRWNERMAEGTRYSAREHCSVRVRDIEESHAEKSKNVRQYCVRDKHARTLLLREQQL